MAPVPATPSAQPRDEKRSAVSVTTVSRGWASDTSSAVRQSPETRTAPSNTTSSRRSVSGRRARTWARTGSPTGVRDVRGSTGGGDREDCAGEAARRERSEGVGRAGGRVDDDGAQHVGRDRLDGAFPPGIDLDGVEQGAQHAADADQPLGACALAGLVERHGERLGPRSPAVLLGRGRLVVLGGGVTLDHGGLEPRRGVDRLGLEPRRRGAALVELGHHRRGLGPALLGTTGQDASLGVDPFEVGCRPARRGASGRQLGADRAGIDRLGRVSDRLPAPPTRPRSAPGRRRARPRPRRRAGRSSR